jgi:hypothetical protein
MLCKDCFRRNVGPGHDGYKCSKEHESLGRVLASCRVSSRDPYDPCHSDEMRDSTSKFVEVADAEKGTGLGLRARKGIPKGVVISSFGLHTKVPGRQLNGWQLGYSLGVHGDYNVLPDVTPPRPARTDLLGGLACDPVSVIDCWDVLNTANTDAVKVVAFIALTKNNPKTNCIIMSSGEPAVYTLRSRRKIPAGETLYVEYGWKYWLQQISLGLLGAPTAASVYAGYVAQRILINGVTGYLEAQIPIAVPSVFSYGCTREGVYSVVTGSDEYPHIPNCTLVAYGFIARLRRLPYRENAADGVRELLRADVDDFIENPGEVVHDTTAGALVDAIIALGYSRNSPL